MFTYYKANLFKFYVLLQEVYMLKMKTNIFCVHVCHEDIIAPVTIMKWSAWSHVRDDDVVMFVTRTS